MTNRTAKTRTYRNTVAGQRQLIVDRAPDPPAELAEYPGAAEHWFAILACRLADDWSQHDLRQVAHISKLMSMIDTLLDEINAEGHVIGIRGRMVANPKTAILQGYLASCGSMRRGLSLGTKVDRRTVTVNPKQRAMAKRVQETDDDDLIG